MPDFERGAIVRVPFPCTDRDTRQHRPALVISIDRGRDGALLWVLMITSAANQRWDDDVDLDEGFLACGLPAPSLIRTAKIATIDATSAQILGMLDPSRMNAVTNRVRGHLALD